MNDAPFLWSLSRDTTEQSYCRLSFLISASVMDIPGSLALWGLPHPVGI